MAQKARGRMALIEKLRRMVQDALATVQFRLHMVRLALVIPGIPAGADDGTVPGDGGDGSGKGDAGDNGDDGAGASAGSDSDDDDITSEDDWKTKARKHEKANKKKDDRITELEKQVKAYEDADKTESQKAIDDARAEGRSEAEAEYAKTRRSDRLAVAVAGKARDLADVQDVVLNIEAAIANGVIDATDIFDENDKVNTKEFESALEDLLKRKPHLKAGPNGRSAGDGDAGKGAGSAGASGDFNDLIRNGG